MMEKKSYHTFDTLVSAVAASTDKSPGSGKRCDVTRMSCCILKWSIESFLIGEKMCG